MAGFMKASPLLGAAYASWLLLAAATPSYAFPSSPEIDSTPSTVIMSERATNATTLESACQAALATLGEDVVDLTPLDATVVEENWSQSCVQEPYCIFMPRDTNEVAAAVKIIADSGVTFAVRSGGHSPNPGWSSVGSGGVLLDLQKLNSVNVSDDGLIASVGPGARWGDVQSTVGAKGVSVVGGRTPTVGVGGLVLGGGYFHLSPEYGLAADNVANFEVVLSNGTIVNANATENTDLFWALKGGGPNFGIVTRYDLETIPVDNVWYQINVYTPDQVPALLAAIADYQATGGSTDPKGSLSLIIGLQSITLGLIYGSPQATAPSTFDPILNALTPVAVAIPSSNGTFETLNTIAGSLISTTPARHDYRGVSTLVDAQLYQDVYAFWLERATAVYNETGASQTFVIQHVPASLAAASNAKGGNPLGLKEVTHQWWTTLVDWTDEAQDDVVRAVSIETTEKWQTLATERGLNLDFVYMNDASRDQNPLASYGDENLAKLKTIAAKYDAAQMFQTQQNGGWKLSNA